ncbi:hypothetical protein B0H13DRAFT_2286951 [Mycena leptocephala]|nr:hypothetical protein B0H13DRAFT_2286951 [Mycena leptocephala]
MTTWLVVLSFLPPTSLPPCRLLPLPLIYKLSILIVLPPIRMLSRPSRAFGGSDEVLASGDRVLAVEAHMDYSAHQFSTHYQKKFGCKIPSRKIAGGDFGEQEFMIMSVELACGIVLGKSDKTASGKVRDTRFWTRFQGYRDYR